MINILNSLISIFQTILTMSLTASVLAGIIILLRQTIGRWISSRNKALIWLVIVPVLIIPFSAMPIPGFKLNDTISNQAGSASIFQAVNQIAPAPIETKTIDQSSSESLALNETRPTNPTNAGTKSNSLADLLKSLSTAQLVWFAAACIWLFGFVIALSAFLFGFIRTYRKLKKDSVRINPSWQEQFGLLCAHLKVDPASMQLVSIIQNVSPYLIGFRKVRIVIPDSIVRNSDTNQIDAILIHEMTHLRHHDHIFRLIDCLLISLHWFNPIMWIAVRLHLKDSEYYCDASTLEYKQYINRSDYAQALLTTSKQIDAINSNHQSILSASFIESGLRGRIKKILRKNKTFKLLGVLALLILVGAIIIFVPNWGRDSEDPIIQIQIKYLEQMDLYDIEPQGIKQSYELGYDYITLLSNTAINAGWSVQDIRIMDYIGQEIDEYSFIVKGHPLDHIGDFKSTDVTLMVSDDEIIGGYANPNNSEMISGVCYSIDGSRLYREDSPWRWTYAQDMAQDDIYFEGLQIVGVENFKYYGLSYDIDLNQDGVLENIKFELSEIINGKPLTCTLVINDLVRYQLSDQFNVSFENIIVTDLDENDGVYDLTYSYSVDGNMINERTLFLYYDGAELHERGTVECMFPGLGYWLLLDGQGSLRTIVQGNVLHSWSHPKELEIGSNGSFQETQQFYDMYNYPCKMLIDLPIYTGIEDLEPTSVVESGEQIYLIQTDDDEWVQLCTADGKLGWFQVSAPGTIQQVNVGGLYIASGDVFDGLFFDG